MSARPDSLRAVLTEQQLAWLAGPTALSNGRELQTQQKVVFTSADRRSLCAVVSESADFNVSVQLVGSGDISYACSCPVGKMELFCEHCVAASLAWLADNFDEAEWWTDALSVLTEAHEENLVRAKLRRCIEHMSKEDLIEIIEQWAEHDPSYAYFLTTSQRFATLP